MTGILVFISLALLTIIVVQVGKVTELAGKIRGEEEVQDLVNRRNATFSMVFMVLFLIGCIWFRLIITKTICWDTVRTNRHRRTWCGSGSDVQRDFVLHRYRLCSYPNILFSTTPGSTRGAKAEK